MQMAAFLEAVSPQTRLSHDHLISLEELIPGFVASVSDDNRRQAARSVVGGASARRSTARLSAMTQVELPGLRPLPPPEAFLVSSEVVCHSFKEMRCLYPLGAHWACARGILYITNYRVVFVGYASARQQRFDHQVFYGTHIARQGRPQALTAVEVEEPVVEDQASSGRFLVPPRGPTGDVASDNGWLHLQRCCTPANMVL
jgi:hypothetical protein